MHSEKGVEEDDCIVMVQKTSQDNSITTLSALDQVLEPFKNPLHCDFASPTADSPHDPLPTSTDNECHPQSQRWQPVRSCCQWQDSRRCFCCKEISASVQPRCLCWCKTRLYKKRCRTPGRQHWRGGLGAVQSSRSQDVTLCHTCRSCINCINA